MDREFYLRRYEEELGKVASSASDAAAAAHEALAQCYKEAAERVANPTEVRVRLRSSPRARWTSPTIIQVI